MEIDNSIRFAGFANNMGTVISAQYRQVLKSVEEREQSLLTNDDLGLSVIESVLRMLTRRHMMSKLGRPIYTFTSYENVKKGNHIVRE